MSYRNSMYSGGYLLLFASLFYSGLSGAANRQDLQQLQAAEKIQIVSQQIPKAYFYLHQGIRVEQAKKDLKNGMKALKRNIKILSKTRDKEQLGMVEFMSYTQDEMKSTMIRPFNKERGALMLDYGEVLLEGAESLVAKHIHKNDQQEEMLVVTEQMSFLLERATKYYIAFRAGFTDENNVKQLQRAIAKFESHLKRVSAYKYPDSLSAEVTKLTEYWPRAKSFYLGITKKNLPLIVFITTQHLEKSIKVLENHHQKKARK